MKNIILMLFFIIDESIYFSDKIMDPDYLTFVGLGYIFLVFILPGIILGLITGFLGRYISKQKGRSTKEGFLLGFFFSFLGVIISLFLPNKN